MDLYYYGCLSNSTRRRRRRWRRMIHTDDGQTAISARLGPTVFRGLGRNSSSGRRRRRIIRRVLAIITTTILGRVHIHIYIYMFINNVRARMDRWTDSDKNRSAGYEHECDKPAGCTHAPRPILIVIPTINTRGRRRCRRPSPSPRPCTPPNRGNRPAWEKPADPRCCTGCLEHGLSQRGRIWPRTTDFAPFYGCSENKWRSENIDFSI